MTDTVHITFFEDRYAINIKTADLTLEELRGRILNTKASTKEALPWLKLAIFGKKRQPKSRSLRSDANLQQITGCELDYDGKQVGFDQAVEWVKEMGIKALVYTSPSHTAAEPKWRILAPTSKPSPPELHPKLVARMNGFMGERLGLEGGILGKHPESFTLSQSYYYGRAEDNAASNHMAVITDGKYIDMAVDELYRYQARGEKSTAGGNSNGSSNPFTDAADEADAAKGQSQSSYSSHGFEAILKEIGDGEGLGGFNEVLIRAVASYVGAHNGHPFDEEKLKKLLRQAIEDAPKANGRSHKDIPRYLSDKYLDACITSAKRKFSESMPITVEDFVSFLPTGEYIFILTRAIWVGKSINSRIPPIPEMDRQGRPKMRIKKGSKIATPVYTKPTQWLDKNRAVEQMTWVPGEPLLIKDKLMVHNAGWVKKKGTNTFNLYIPPSMRAGNPSQALPWIHHIERVYPDDAEHLINYLAHRVQKPADKINHALLLGGGQGIGKDTMLEPIRRAIGPWNFKEVNPSSMLGAFNPYLRSVILRINEVRDLGEISRYAFYEHLKRICASPPETLQVNEKNLREHDIMNCCGVIMTTNHKTDGIYLPADDRRTYVAWSRCLKEEFTSKYWDEIYSWYDNGGDSHVMAYLQERDLSGFNAKAPPLLTAAFKIIVSANRGEGENELADALDELGRPPAVILDQILLVVEPDFADWMLDRKNRKSLAHRLESQGYDSINNPADKRDGQWQIHRRRINIYGLNTLSAGQQLDAAEGLKRFLEDNPQNPNSPRKSNVFDIKRPK